MNEEISKENAESIVIEYEPTQKSSMVEEKFLEEV